MALKLIKSPNASQLTQILQDAGQTEKVPKVSIILEVGAYTIQDEINVLVDILQDYVYIGHKWSVPVFIWHDCIMNEEWTAAIDSEDY